MSVPPTNAEADLAVPAAGTPVRSLTNAFLKDLISNDALKSPLASPTFTGTPAAPTAAANTNTTQLATTAHVFAERANTITFTNKTYDTAGTGNSFSINGVAVTANAGTGAVARATSPTFVTPVLGVATATSLNGNTFTAGTYTLTGTAGKTLNFTNTLTLGGTDGSTVAFGAGGTIAYANATVTLSANTNLVRATHGNRLIIADTGAITLTVEDDTTGVWGSGDAIYGINTSTGFVTLAGDGTSTVTAEYGQTLVIPPNQEFSLVRTAANTWFGGGVDSGLRQNSQSTAYTTVMADRNQQILHPTADNNARTFTIDSNANVPYPIGTTLTFINQINTVTIAITSDTLTLAGAGTTGSRSLAANGIATSVKVSSTGWLINGTGLT